MKTMGYLHDTSMAQWVSPADCQYSAGTWTDAVASNIWSRNRSAADAAFTIRIPVTVLQNAVALKGSKIASVDIYYEVATAAMDSVAVAAYKAVAPANGAAWPAVTTPTVTYDSGHDSAAERITVDEHKLTLSFSSPAWLDDDDVLSVELACDAAATSVFKFYGARVNYTLRV
jgi:hypothetical protein